MDRLPASVPGKNGDEFAPRASARWRTQWDAGEQRKGPEPIGATAGPRYFVSRVAMTLIVVPSTTTPKR